MRLSFNYKENNIVKTAKKLRILSNPNHLRILLLLKSALKPMTTEEIRVVLEAGGVYKHRENTHKALQKLVKLGLVKKNKGPGGVRDVYEFCN